MAFVVKIYITIKDIHVLFFIYISALNPYNNTYNTIVLLAIYNV